MTEREKRKFIDYLKLEKKLENASRDGSMLMFEGRYDEAEPIATACVFNDCGYYMEEISTHPGGKNEVIFIGRGKRN